MKAGQPEQAAELYYQLSDFNLAGLFFAKAGRPFDAAKAAAEANLEPKMVEYLQQVAPGDPNYLVAVLQLARAFERRGWASLAREKLSSVLRGQEVTAGNLELWDALSKAEEAQGHFEDAASILHRILTVQYSYPGASERYTALEKRMGEEKKRSETLRSRVPAVVKLGEKRRYEVQGMLGQGGMGAVYRAYDHLLKRNVAYKVLAESFSRDSEAREQLLNEARASAQLNHPNIVTVFNLGFDGDEAFICMELVEGESYHAILRARTRLEIEESIAFSGLRLPGARSRPRPRHRSPGHEAFERAAQRGRPGQDPRLRSRSSRGPERPAGGPGCVLHVGNAEVHLTRSRPGASRRHALRRVFAGCDALRAARGSSPLHRRQPLHAPSPYAAAPAPSEPEREINPKLEELVLLCLAKSPGDRFQTTREILSFASAARLL